MTDYNTSTAPDLPMKWHKFIAYFALWLGALSEIVQAAMLMTGAHYGAQRDAVYQVFGSMKAVDILCAVGYILIAIFSIYTALQLIRLKENAPKKLMVLYIISAALPILYPILASLCTGVPIAELMDSSAFSTLIGSVVGVIICKVYYDKRAHMFIN